VRVCVRACVRMWLLHLSRVMLSYSLPLSAIETDTYICMYVRCTHTLSLIQSLSFSQHLWSACTRRRQKHAPSIPPTLAYPHSHKRINSHKNKDNHIHSHNKIHAHLHTFSLSRSFSLPLPPPQTHTSVLSECLEASASCKLRALAFECRLASGSCIISPSRPVPVPSCGL